jgi:hypothetical protein
MKNYKISVEPGEQEDVLTILELSNDVLIDRVTDDTILFTIELDDDEADQLYKDLLNEIEVKVYASRNHI